VGITRNEVEAAAEEIRRITATPVVVPEPVPEPVQTESSELIYRRNDRVTQEELQEMMESFRRSENLQRREIEQRDQQMETQRRNTTTVTTNSMRTLSRQEAEDIEALVSRGVRSQMSTISEQVLQKLEKKLKNEKIRRGI
jgi:predicted metal-dependent hydrolase